MPTPTRPAIKPPRPPKGAATPGKTGVADSNFGPITPGPQTFPHDATLAARPVLNVLRTVADWQLANPSQHPPYHWPQAAFYTGLVALADTTDEERYWAALRDKAAQSDFHPGPREGHADDAAVSQLYASLYLRDRDPRLLAPSSSVSTGWCASPTAHR